MSDSDCCVMCDGIGKNQFNEGCTYCNATGEPNNLAEEYLRNHICQCIVWDRKFCPVCKQKCHHDTTHTPKQRIEPGYGGLVTGISSEIENEMVM